MARYQVLYWKDIPAQVKVLVDGKRPLSGAMPPRFQIQIDRVAMEQGLAGTDDYLNQWHWSEKREREGTPEEVLEAVLRELEAQS